jgi:aminopeptidase N
VRPASYRDAWLSEGLATYAGISYLQAARRRNDDYFRFLDQYRGDILRHRDDAGLVAIGYRNATFDVPQGYTYSVYEKGAWVFHMLRVMLLDLSTLRAERFNAMLADYYQSFRGYAVTTGDFGAVAERHVGRPLDWFFDQWLNRSDVPTYRVAWRAEPAEDGRYRVRLRVRQERVAPDFQMPVLVAVDLGGDRTARFRVTVRGDQQEYLGPLLPAPPRRVTFNEYRSVLAEVVTEDW